MFIIHFFFDSTHTKSKSIYFFKHTSISSTRTHPSNTHIVIDHFISISKTSPLYILHTMQSRVSNDDRQNNQLKMITQLNKKHEILTILQLCKSHLKIQQYNSVVSTDILINNYLYLINNLNYKPFQVIWNLSKIYQQKDLYHLACNLLKEYLDTNESKIKYEDPFDEFIKQDISLHDLQLIQLDSDDQDQDDLIISEVWASLGHCYLMIEDLPNAYLTYQKALYILPNVKCSKLWKGIGILYDRYGSLDYAEEAFAKVLEIENYQDTSLKEDQNEIYFRLGIIYKHQLKYHQSLECFRFIIYNPPAPLKECDIWFQLGQVCELMKDYENAKLAYTECCLLNNNHHKAWSCLAVIYLLFQERKINNLLEQNVDINVEIQQNKDQFYEDTTMALQCLNNHSNIDVGDLMSWYFSGRAYLLLRDYQTSYEYYQNCINKDPNNGIFWCSIGILYYAIGQYHDALDAYSRAIRLNPYLWEVWYDLGILYEACGDDEQQLKDAIDAFTQADRLRPGHHAIEMKLKVLTNKESPNNSLPKWIEPELPFQQPNGMVSEIGEMKLNMNQETLNNKDFNTQPVNKGLESLVAAAAMSHPATNAEDKSVTSNSEKSALSGPKKRGRKPKNPNGPPRDAINNGSVSSDESMQPAAGIKKRGRPLGRKNKTSVSKGDMITNGLLQTNPAKESIKTSVNPLIGNSATRFTMNTPKVNISTLKGDGNVPSGRDRLPVFNSVSNKQVQPALGGTINRPPKVTSGAKGIKINLADLAAVSEQQQKQKEKMSNPLLNLVNAVETSNKVVVNEEGKEELKQEDAKVAEPSKDEIQEKTTEEKKNESPGITEDKSGVEKPLVAEEKTPEEEEVKELQNQIQASVHVVMRNMDEDDNYDD